MMRPVFPVSLAVLVAIFALAGSAMAQNAPKRGNAGTPFLGFGSNSREPVKVDANRLEVFDKESKAVYSGDVVAVQGQSILRCASMIISYAQARGGAAPAPGSTSIRQIECEGPVSVLSGTLSATSQKMVYDAASDTVTLTGKVVIADCENVQRGERVVYDVKTGRAKVEAGPSGRVQGVFTPGSDNPGGSRNAGTSPARAKECPAPARP
jgi:lipopolysaccharide export system protein LptA